MTLIGWQVASVNIRIMAPKSRKRQMMFVVTRRYAFRYVTLFWATVCKTIRSILSVLCPVCRSVCLSCPVTLVYSGQTAGCIKMKLGTEVGLGPGHICQMATQLFPKKVGAQPPIFGPCLLCLHELRCHLVRTKVGLGPGDCVRCGPSSPQKGDTVPSSPNFRPMSIVAKRLDGSR